MAAGVPAATVAPSTADVLVMEVAVGRVTVGFVEFIVTLKLSYFAKVVAAAVAE